jgi:hypothetical protein
MTDWLVQMQGNGLYLQKLKEILSSHDPTIIQENNDFYLKSKQWDELPEAEQVHYQAKRFV